MNLSNVRHVDLTGWELVIIRDAINSRMDTFLGNGSIEDYHELSTLLKTKLKLSDRDTDRMIKRKQQNDGGS